MKSILLYANKDSGLESRLQAALDVARAVEGHVTALQVRPLPLVAPNDGMAGIAGYDLTAQMEAEYGAAAAENRKAVEARLAGETLPFDWVDDRGDAAQVVVDHSKLADLAVLSLASARLGLRDQLPMVGSVAVNARTPVLAVPATLKRLDVFAAAIVAWNGSFESAHALRFAAPLLKRAGRVVVLCAGGDQPDGALPGLAAASYLDRHGIKVDIVERHGDPEPILLGAAREFNASYIVMGAYGHSRVREYLLGGVTRSLLSNTQVPLLLAH